MKPLDPRTLRWVTTALTKLARTADRRSDELRGTRFTEASKAHGRYAGAYRHAISVIKARSKPACTIEKSRAKKAGKP